MPLRSAVTGRARCRTGRGNGAGARPGGVVNARRRRRCVPGAAATCGRDEELTGYLVSELPLQQNGPATVVIASGSCAGHQLRVREKDGTLELQDPAD